MSRVQSPHAVAHLRQGDLLFGDLRLRQGDLRFREEDIVNRDGTRRPLRASSFSVSCLRSCEVSFRGFVDVLSAYLKFRVHAWRHSPAHVPFSMSWMIAMAWRKV